VLYSQFASHNAHCTASIVEMTPRGTATNFSACMAMGRLLYAEAARQNPNLLTAENEIASALDLSVHAQPT
jgi:hypothetical protein